MERNVVYLPIPISSHATLMTSKYTMAFCNLIGSHHCSAVSKKTACKCFTASILALILDFFVKVLTETNVNISSELNFPEVYRSVNYIGSLAKFI